MHKKCTRRTSCSRANTLVLGQKTRVVIVAGAATRRRQIFINAEKQNYGIFKIDCVVSLISNNLAILQRLFKV